MIGEPRNKTMKYISEIRTHIRDLHITDEVTLVTKLIKIANLSEIDRSEIVKNAAHLVERIRSDKKPGLMEVFLSEYGLSNSEGIALMCLAEALLRVPDAYTMDELIKDKLTDKGWSKHIGNSSSSLVNASTWALMLTGKVLDKAKESRIHSAMHRLIKRVGEPVIRRAVKAAMKEMGNQFVLGETIEKAVKRGQKRQKNDYTYSYDMLGEAAITNSDAIKFTKAYADTISYLAKHSKDPDVRNNPGISIKLSALFPRYELTHKSAVLETMGKRLSNLILMARNANMGLNIDAEEADRLDLSLDVIEQALSDPRLKGWDGFGVVVQAYGKRAIAIIDWLYALSEKLDRKIMVRLVKGAYWDTEIKKTQTNAFDNYPVFTKKCATDVSYLACARKLLDFSDRIYPQFATHNAHSVHAVLRMAKINEKYEFQRLHGMGGALYDHAIALNKMRCRIYAPVGIHDNLLAYLVRRLLENGANSSFVNKILDKDVPSEEVVFDPIIDWNTFSKKQKWLTKPADLYQPERKNSLGYDITSVNELERINLARNNFAQKKWAVSSHLVSGNPTGFIQTIINPADTNDIVGTVINVSKNDVIRAIENARPWNIPHDQRAEILNKIADLYESNFGELFAILSREAGKTLKDSVAEIRESVDFIRYYAAKSKDFIDHNPRGNFACISPWNFPLAIFTGQIIAALSVGNAVLAKPAEPTPIIASRAVSLILEAGVPATALQLLVGSGSVIGANLIKHKSIDGVCFTGSTKTAQSINIDLAKIGNPYAPLIAETGGLNAMIVDSTALPEQAIQDIIASSFQSAGQRCSALRMLYVQRDIADKFLDMLYGAMDELISGNPWDANTDVGPIITKTAAKYINDYIKIAMDDGRILHQSSVPNIETLVKPTVISVTSIKDMEKEIFGPVLHVTTFEAREIPSIIENINKTEYGLTFGIHSRIEARIHNLCSSLNVGNIYVNRNQIGAVVGSQPFGGEGLSGTGPKAGGPNYLKHFLNVSDPVREKYDTPAVTTNAQEILNEVITPERKALNISTLPGPTGELNILSSYPKGVVLCLGPTSTQAQQQAKLAHDAGCKTCIVLNMDLSELTNLKGFDVVIFWAEITEIQKARTYLAVRNGVLIPLITDRNIVERCILERHVCIDTTAAGGNIALLASGG